MQLRRLAVLALAVAACAVLRLWRDGVVIGGVPLVVR